MFPPGRTIRCALASRSTTPPTVTNHLVRCSRSVIISPYVVSRASLLGRRTYLNARYSINTNQKPSVYDVVETISLPTIPNDPHVFTLSRANTIHRMNFSYKDVQQVLSWDNFDRLVLSFADRFQTNSWDLTEMPRTSTGSPPPMPVRDEKTVVARLQENFLPLVRRTLRCLRSPLTVDLGIAIIDGADCDLAGFIPGELDQHNRYLTRITGDIKPNWKFSANWKDSEVQAESRELRRVSPSSVSSSFLYVGLRNAVRCPTLSLHHTLTDS
jgi:hypothetical protein